MCSARFFIPRIFGEQGSWRINKCDKLDRANFSRVFARRKNSPSPSKYRGEIKIIPNLKKQVSCPPSNLLLLSLYKMRGRGRKEKMYDRTLDPCVPVCERTKKEERKKKIGRIPLKRQRQKETRKKRDKVRSRMDVWWTVSRKYVRIVRAYRK